MTRILPGEMNTVLFILINVGHKIPLIATDKSIKILNIDLMLFKLFTIYLFVPYRFSKFTSIVIKYREDIKKKKLKIQFKSTDH